jgi:hypothetical protein
MTPLDAAKELMEARAGAITEEVTHYVGHDEYDYFGTIRPIKHRYDRMTEQEAYTLSSFLALAANHCVAICARLIELEAKAKRASDAFAECESVRTFRNDINSHEWLALVAAMEAIDATIPPTD